MPQLPLTMQLQPIYELQANGQTLLRVTAEVPVWAPRPALPTSWLRSAIALAIRRWFASR
jgi:hypothetical protein